ncbi:MAG: methyltransferase [Clostridiales bacterium]|nr:methyltransferase [Clostridiales bacterium]
MKSTAKYSKKEIPNREAEYICTFISGFSDIVSKQIKQKLKGVKIIRLFDGLIHFLYAGSPFDISRLVFLNNTFFVISKFTSKNLTFKSMALQVSKINFRIMDTKAESFRVRFSKENKFEKVPERVSDIAEYSVKKNSSLKIDRINPSTEFWFIIRREGIGFFAQLLKKRGATEKSLRKGELRPELAHLLCGAAEIKPHYTVLDPFAGYGSIPNQILQNFKFKKMYINDIDKNLADKLRKSPLGENALTEITNVNADNMAHIPSNSVDIIITDPPWGIFENIADISKFYAGFLKEFKRVLKNGATAILLTGSPLEALDAAKTAALTTINRRDILVNGKKASVIVLKKQKEVL